MELFDHTAIYVYVEEEESVATTCLFYGMFFVCLALNDSGLGADILCCCTYISERFLQ